MRRHPVTTSNESTVTVPVFTTDPHGPAMFVGILNGTLGHLGARPVIDAGKGPRWQGPTAPPQSMRGAGNIGGSRPVNPGSSRLDQERTASDPIQTAFEQRMIARRFS